MGISEWMSKVGTRLAANGVGVSSTTQSLLPALYSVTKTPEAKYETQARQENENRPLLTSKAASVPDIYDKGSASKDKAAQLVHVNLKKYEPTYDLGDARSFREFIDKNPALLKNPKPSDLDALKYQISHAIDSTKELTGEIAPRELAGVDHLVLAQAVLLACKDMREPAASAARGLACLRNLNLLEQIRNPMTLDEALKRNFSTDALRSNAPSIEDLWTKTHIADGFTNEVLSELGKDFYKYLPAPSKTSLTGGFAEEVFQELSNRGISFEAEIASLKKSNLQTQIKPASQSGTDSGGLESTDTRAEINRANTFIPCPKVGNQFHLGKFTAEDYANAWRIAQQLEQTPTGFNILKRITLQQSVPSGLDASFTRHDDAALHIFLKGSREKVKWVKEMNPDEHLDPDPHSVFQHIEGVKGELTLLDKGLLAIQDHLRQSAASASDPIARTKNFSLVKNKNAWAAYAIRNQIYTDFTLDLDGKLSQFARLDGRSKKMATWLRRTTNLLDATRMAQLGTYVKNFFTPQNNKSPFNAFDRLGPTRWEGFKLVNKNGIGFKNSFWNGIGDGRAMKESMMGALESALKEKIANYSAGGDNLNKVALPNQRSFTSGRPLDATTLSNLTRLAILEQQKDPTENRFLTRFKALQPLSPQGVDRAIKRLSGWLDDGSLNDPESVALIRQSLVSENKALTPQRIIAWAKDVGYQDNFEGDDVAPMVPNKPLDSNIHSKQHLFNLNDKTLASWVSKTNEDNSDKWGGFRKASERVLDKRRNLELSKDGKASQEKAKIAPLEAETDASGEYIGIPKTSNMTPESAASMFSEAISRQELGSSFELTSGGLVGVKTGGITETISAMQTGGFVRGKIDLRGERQRLAYLKAGTGTSGNELIYGSVKVNKNQYGVGESYGPGKVSKKLGGGTTVGAGISSEQYSGKDITELKATVLRFPRLETVVNGDEANNKKLAKLSEEMMLYDPKKDDLKLGSPLKRALQDYGEDLSVSWLDYEEKTTRVFGGSIAAGAGFSVGSLGATAGVSVAVKHKKFTETWRETGGALHVDKDTTSEMLNASLSGTLASISKAFPQVSVESVGSVLRQGLGEGAAQLSLNVVTELLGSSSAQIYKWGKTTRDTWIERDGELKNSATFRTVTYPNAESFIASVAKKLDVAAIDKTKKYVGSQYHAYLNDAAAPSAEIQKAHEEERATAIRREYEELSKHLEAARANANMTHGFQEYYEPKKEVVKAMNDYKSLAIQAEAMGDVQTGKAYRQMISKMAADDNSWEWSFVVTIEKEAEQVQKGLDFIVKYQQIDAMNTSAIVDFN